MKTHILKLNLEFCDDVLDGSKPFEVRENDRGFQKGDLVIFEPYHRCEDVSNHPIKDKTYEITYVLNGWGIKNGYVAFGILPVI